MSQDRPISQELAEKLGVVQFRDKIVILTPPITDPARLLPAPVEPKPETVE